MALVTYDMFKSVLFRIEPETAHSLASIGFQGLRFCPPLINLLACRYFIDHPMLQQHFFGRTFRNPVGLGAGFDKNAACIDAMRAMGFGFTEVGTVTPKAQQGNPKPRLFRLVEEQSIQNAMGFNNDGKYTMQRRLKRYRFLDYPIGVNVGKNKTTPEEKALDDYAELFEAFNDRADYLVVNISSPNTPGLRDLQNERFIRDVFSLAKTKTDRPVLLKIAPDMEPSDAIALCETAVDAGAAGIIATNTTIDYSLTPHAKDFGGISGALLKEKSFALFEAIGQAFYDKTLLISVGGIDSPEEAYRRIQAGASLVQVFTPFIYHGPDLIRHINEGLVKRLQADGFEHISQAVGARWRK